MIDPNSDHSIKNEPHLHGGGLQPDPSEQKASRILNEQRLSEDELVEHSVWDEPALSKDLIGGPPKDALTYADWLTWRREQMSAENSWAWVFLLALVAGPWAILGALMNSSSGTMGVVLLTIIGPLSEEVMKSAAVLWVIEKRPFVFTSRLQIVLCLLASAFCFSAVENVLYLNVFTNEPNHALFLWRWTVCVALHMGCTAISGMGLVRIWNETMEHLTKPELSRWFPFLMTAAAIHGVYNTSALVLEKAVFHF